MGAGASQQQQGGAPADNGQQQQQPPPKSQEAPRQSAHDSPAQEHRTAAAKVQAVSAFQKAGESKEKDREAKERPEKEKKQSQKEEDEDDEAAWQREKEKLQLRMKERREKEERERAEKGKQAAPPPPAEPDDGGKDKDKLGASQTDANGKPKKKLLNGTNIEYKYPSGSAYIGGFKDGKLHGFGKYKYHPSGDIYEGEWLADMKHGKGTYTYEGGDRYSGEWRAGKKHGKGTYVFQTGDEYVGSWKEDKIHGYGVFSIARNGNRYEGNWEESYRHGHGVLRSGNGDVYEGNWVRGKEEGPGVLTYRDGNIYAGDWRSGQMDGKGIMLEKDQKFLVEHIAGYPISKVPVEMEGTVDPDWNSANRFFEAHMKKKQSAGATASPTSATGSHIENSDAYMKVSLERDMYEKKYNELLNRKLADDFDEDDDSIQGLRTRLQRVKEQRDLEKQRADDSVAKEKVLTAEVQELKFKLTEVENLKEENQRLKQGGGGGGADSAEMEKLQRKCAELERQVQLTRQNKGTEGLDPLELKAKLELQESEMKSLKAARDELKKVREQALDNQRTIMNLEGRNEELLKEINVMRQRATNLHSQLNDAQVGSDQAAELKELRRELEEVKDANGKLEKKVKKGKEQEKALEDRARRADELEVEIAKLKQSKQSGEAITFKTLDKKSDELDRLREKNAELQRKLEEAAAETEVAEASAKKKKKKKGEAQEEAEGGLNAEELQVKLEGLQADLKKEKKKSKKLATERDVYEQQLLADQAALRKVQQQLAVAHGRILVYGLIRPLLSYEVERGDTAVIVAGEHAGTVVNRETQDTFTFDEVFLETATGAELFAEAQPTVRKVVEGSHAALISFGPMEAGKTFYASQIAPLAIEELFNSFKGSSLKTKVVCTAVEVTADGVIDLNSGSSAPSSIVIRKTGYGVVTLLDAVTVACSTAAEATRAYAAAISSKTKSRSHFCFFLDVQMVHPVLDSVGIGKLSLIDLAGPGELGRQSDIVSGKYVNNSNRALSNVITALAEKAAAVPYKDDPICTILSDCFGGNSRTHLFVHCSPSGYSANETTHSLQLAYKCCQIYNRPLRQFETRDTTRLRNLVASSCSEEQARPQNYEITTYVE